MACGESRAHYNYLTQKNILQTYVDNDNVNWYIAC